MVMPIRYAPICVSIVKVAMRASHKVLMEVDDNISLIVGDQQGIFDQHLRPRPMHFLNILNILILYQIIK
jgi:hypothetical protein